MDRGWTGAGTVPAPPARPCPAHSPRNRHSPAPAPRSILQGLQRKRGHGNQANRAGWDLNTSLAPAERRELFGGSHCRFPWKKLPQNSLPDKLLGKLQRFQSSSLMVLMGVISLLPALYSSKIQLHCLSSRVQNWGCVCFENNAGLRKGSVVIPSPALQFREQTGNVQRQEQGDS